MTSQREHWCPYLASPEFEKRLALALLFVNDNTENSLDPCAYYGPEIGESEAHKHAAAVIRVLNVLNENSGSSTT